MIRLLLVEDHRASREPLAMLLDRQSDLTVVEQANSSSDVAKIVANGVHVDVAVVEIDLGDGSGLDAIRQLRSGLPESEVLVLTGNLDQRRHGCALRAGASGIVPKTAAPDDVIAAVRRLAASENLMPLPVAAALLELSAQYQQEGDSVRAAVARLTPRELEVLCGLAGGMSNQAIANQLCIGSETVRSQIVRILHKLGTKSRLQAAVLVIRHGLNLE